MKARVQIFDDMEALSRAAADRLEVAAQEAIESRGRFLIALNGGKTPLRFLQLLASEYQAQIDWQRAHLFWGDERCVPPDHPESSYGQAREVLLSHLELPDDHVHRIRGELGAGAAAADYARALKQFADPGLEWPRFDLVLLGLGEDGHIASLFPGSDPSEAKPVIPVTARYQDRPAERVSLTPPVFNSARLVIFMVTGPGKAAALQQALGDEFEPEKLPAQRIGPKDGKLIWLVDEAAASRLPKSFSRSRGTCEG